MEAQAGARLTHRDGIATSSLRPLQGTIVYYNPVSQHLSATVSPLIETQTIFTAIYATLALAFSPYVWTSWYAPAPPAHTQRRRCRCLALTTDAPAASRCAPPPGGPSPYCKCCLSQVRRDGRNPVRQRSCSHADTDECKGAPPPSPGGDAVLVTKVISTAASVAYYRLMASVGVANQSLSCVPCSSRERASTRRIVAHLVAAAHA